MQQLAVLKKFYFSVSILFVFILACSSGIKIEENQPNDSKVSELVPLSEINFQVWQHDSLIVADTLSANKPSIKIRTGIYNLRFLADGYAPIIMDSVKIERFKKTPVTLDFQPPPSRAVEHILDAAVDTNLVLAKAGPKDIWLRQNNTVTGTPHRIVGSSVKLPKAPRNEEEAKKLAHEFLAQFIAENSADSSIAQIDPNTLVPIKAFFFNGKWRVTFTQKVKVPYWEEPVPVFGSQASVVIKDENVVQFGFDAFPVNELHDANVLSQEKVINSVKRQVNFSSYGEFSKTIFPTHSLKTNFSFIPAYEFNTFQNSETELPIRTRLVVASAIDGSIVFDKLGDIINSIAETAIYPKAPEVSDFVRAPIRNAIIVNFEGEEIATDFDGIFEDSNPEILKLLNDHVAVVTSNWFGEWLLKEPRGVPQMAPRYVHRIKFSKAITKIIDNNSEKSYFFDISPELNCFYHIQEIKEYFGALGLDALLSTIKIRATILDNYRESSYSPAVKVISFGKNHGIIDGYRSNIIYHEYSHGVLCWMIHASTSHDPMKLLPYIYESGAIHEAFADYFACSKINSPYMIIDPSAGLPVSIDHLNRTLKNDYRMEDYRAHFKTPVELLPFVKEKPKYLHDNSQILSGALWDMRELLIHRCEGTSGRELSDNLVLDAATIPPIPQTFSDFASNILLANDDDARLYNGTPDFWQLYEAFVRHNIPIPCFEYEKPYIFITKITNSLVASPNHFEEGGKGDMAILVREEGYGINTRKVKIYINEKALTESQYELKILGNIANIHITLNDHMPVRSREFGDALKIRLIVPDLACSDGDTLLTYPILDTQKPKLDGLPQIQRFRDSNGQEYADIHVTIVDVGSGPDINTAYLNIDGEAKVVNEDFAADLVDDQTVIFSIRLKLDKASWSVDAGISDHAGNTFVYKDTVQRSCLSHLVFPISTVMLAMLFVLPNRRQRKK